jgi:D-methionine transport system ATP-binding protein
MIFQHFNPLSSKTVADNIALPLKIAGRSRGERRIRVNDLLQSVGVEDKASAYRHSSRAARSSASALRALAAERSDVSA